MIEAWVMEFLNRNGFGALYVCTVLETSGMPHVSSACHHFTTYIVVKRDTCVNDTRFTVDGPLAIFTNIRNWTFHVTWSNR